MRKRKYLIGALAAATVGIIPASASGAVLTQTMEAQVSPTKVSNKTYKPAKLTVATHATWDSYGVGAGGADPAATNVAIQFDRDIRFNSKGLPQCAESQIAGNKPTAQAIAACGNAVVGSGTANVNGVVGPHSGVVTAFNGVPSGRNPTILLHAYVPTLATANILVGTLVNNVLNVEIKAGQLAGGKEVITDFSTTVNKKFKVKKKVKGKKKKVKVGYVEVRCKDRTWNYSGIFNFSHFTAGINTGPAGSLTASATQKCKPVKKKKKK